MYPVHRWPTGGRVFGNQLTFLNLKSGKGRKNCFGVWGIEGIDMIDGIDFYLYKILNPVIQRGDAPGEY